MINYSLKCGADHRFDSWFQSAEAFDKLQSAGMVACAICGSTDVQKDLMAPSVSSRRKDGAPPEESAQQDGGDEAPAPGPLSEPASPAEQALRALRAQVEANSDYVGRDFAREARAMHSGEAPQRAIWGETRGDEAKALIEEGVPVTPLPFRPTRKNN
ncbi:DUF1178 family protein [Salipiger mucosus]|uniref:Identified by similarity to GB.1, match to protein family HMM n=1 Tax=Salipiger mucosus DSM 16094 TaxID=1123237 RepID=S9QQR7_9RHOB|nr:DUF1178 family protein [Salipiger mucosus]EPX81997.1 identified by similarity to GB.1, match to protein family HMM [Salipiger mucosus DSM 16094]